ncbi:uncharacterized protein LOC124276501 [Haliotis rubra]|uniref:uncharacterized protein LOC124276501 n=1 Tax=Haliotis rubra TaxID=36100 RepID=UPI001EE4FB5A|nr:uncharacterized protein LOC124276501 [Haliotis rubra]
MTEIVTCDEGMYGTDCTLQCGHCSNRICNNTDGTCQDGCEGNFSAPLCQECLHTNYGATCNETCGNCAGTDRCDTGTGECPYGCVSGYDQADVRCKNALAHSPGLDNSIIAGGAAVSALAVVVVVVAAVVICRRRTVTKDKREKDNADGSSLHPQYDMITMVDNSVNGERSEGYLVDDEPTRASPAALLDDEAARAPPAAPRDGGPTRASPAALLDGEPARAPPAAPLDGEPTKTTPAALLDGEPTRAISEPVLDDEDEDAMFSLETGVAEDVETAATYYNWIPPHMALDKLPQCIEKKKKKSSFQAEFQAIPYGARRSHEVGKKPDNKNKNRFVALYSCK